MAHTGEAYKVLVIRSSKHTDEIKRMSLTEALDELRSVFVIREGWHIPDGLTACGHVETLDHLYELTAVI